MMKRVIFCEGKNDCLFLKAFFDANRLYEDTDIKIYDGQGMKMNELFHHESEVVKSFLENTSPYKVLIKSEGGIDKVMDSSQHFMEKLFDNEHQLKETILVIDMDDHRTIDQPLAKLKNKFEGHWTRKIRFDTLTKIENDLVSLIRCTISYKSGDLLGSFFVLIFKPNLEVVSNITKNNGDSDEEKYRKLQNFIQQESIIDRLLEEIG